MRPYTACIRPALASPLSQQPQPSKWHPGWSPPRWPRASWVPSAGIRYAPTCITSRPAAQAEPQRRVVMPGKARRSLETGVSASLADGVWVLMRVPWQCGALQRKEDPGQARSTAWNGGRASLREDDLNQVQGTLSARAAGAAGHLQRCSAALCGAGRILAGVGRFAGWSAWWPSRNWLPRRLILACRGRCHQGCAPHLPGTVESERGPFEPGNLRLRQTVGALLPGKNALCAYIS